MHMLLSSCPCWAHFCWAIRSLRINFSCVRDATTDAAALNSDHPRHGARRCKFAIHAWILLLLSSSYGFKMKTECNVISSNETINNPFHKYPEKILDLLVQSEIPVDK